MGVASRTIGRGVLPVADALSEAKGCGQELSAVTRSGSTSSLFSDNITNDIKPLELKKTVIPFVVGILWIPSVAWGQQSPEIMRPPSYILLSSLLGPGALDVLVTD
jgi:hypothetical protein